MRVRIKYSYIQNHTRQPAAAGDIITISSVISVCGQINIYLRHKVSNKQNTNRNPLINKKKRRDKVLLRVERAIIIVFALSVCSCCRAFYWFGDGVWGSAFILLVVWVGLLISILFPVTFSLCFLRYPKIHLLRIQMRVSAFFIRRTTSLWNLSRRCANIWVYTTRWSSLSVTTRARLYDGSMFYY